MLSAAAGGGGRNDVVWRDDTAGAIRCSRHVDECIAEVVDAKLQSHRIATTATCCAGGRLLRQRARGGGEHGARHQLIDISWQHPFRKIRHVKVQRGREAHTPLRRERTEQRGAPPTAGWWQEQRFVEQAGDAHRRVQRAATRHGRHDADGPTSAVVRLHSEKLGYRLREPINDTTNAVGLVSGRQQEVEIVEHEHCRRAGSRSTQRRLDRRKRGHWRDGGERAERQPRTPKRRRSGPPPGALGTRRGGSLGGEPSYGVGQRRLSSPRGAVHEQAHQRARTTWRVSSARRCGAHVRRRAARLRHRHRPPVVVAVLGRQQLQACHAAHRGRCPCAPDDRYALHNL